MYTVGSFLTDLTKCPRCGQAHPALALTPLDPKGPGKLRDKETHGATCPVTGWAILFQGRWEPTGEPHTYRLTAVAV